MNGTLAAVPALRTLSRGDSAQIVGVTKLFTLAMLSRYARREWRTTLNEDKLQAAIHSGAINILRFFDVPTQHQQAALDEFMSLDAQYNADCDYRDTTKPGQGLGLCPEIIFLLILALREMGHTAPLPITALHPPARDQEDFLMRGGRPPDGVSITELISYELRLVDATLVMSIVHTTFRTGTIPQAMAQLLDPVARQRMEALALATRGDSGTATVGALTAFLDYVGPVGLLH
ncbi:MAG: hypothetical protein ACYDEB_12440 [Dehalococcoidia bacterium]